MYMGTQIGIGVSKLGRLNCAKGPTNTVHIQAGLWLKWRGERSKFTKVNPASWPVLGIKHQDYMNTYLFSIIKLSYSFTSL